MNPRPLYSATEFANRITNWAEYDAALRQRGSLTVWVTPEAIAAWAPATTGRRGRPRDYSDVAIEAGLLLRLAFGRLWRQTEGMLGSIMNLLGLELPVPDHTTFSRRSADLGGNAARCDGFFTADLNARRLVVGRQNTRRR